MPAKAADAVFAIANLTNKKGFHFEMKTLL
jgi:hypothetical protein